MNSNLTNDTPFIISKHNTKKANKNTNYFFGLEEDEVLSDSIPNQIKTTQIILNGDWRFQWKGFSYIQIDVQIGNFSPKITKICHFHEKSGNREKSGNFLK